MRALVPLIPLVLALSASPAGPRAQDAAPVAAPVAAPDAAPDAAPEVVAGEDGARLDAFLTRLLPWGFSGTVLVERDGAVRLHKGYGLADRARGTPATTATVYPYVSIGKQFTAAAVLQLEADGRLSLDDPLAAHLDGVPEDKAAITLRQLLHHASGMAEGVPLAPLGSEDAAARDEDRRATVALLLDTPLVAAPGEAFSYSNAGYALLAAVVEATSEDGFAEHLRRRVLDAAGLHAAPYGSHWRGAPLARGVLGPPGSVEPAPLPVDEPLSFGRIGAGALAGTAADLARWVRALDGDAILPDAQRAEMFRPGLGDYGCAWWIESAGRGRGRVAWHDGLLAGYRIELQRYLDADVTLVVARNTELDGVAARLADVLFGDPVAWPPEVAPPDAAAAAALAGDWGAAPGPTLALGTRDDDPGALHVVPTDQAALDLLDGADEAERARRAADARRTEALLRAVAASRWDDCAHVLGHGETPESCEAALAAWWRRIAQDQGDWRGVVVRVAGRDRDRGAVELELRFLRGAVPRRILWAGDELAGIHVVARPLGARRLLSDAASPGRWVGYRPGAAPDAALVVDDDARALEVHAPDGTTLRLPRAGS